MTHDYDPTSDKNSEPEPLFEFESEKREAIETLVAKFEKFKVKIKYGIFSGDTLIAGKDIETPIIAASTGKLALACMAIDRLFDAEITVLKDNIIPGGSELDNMSEDRDITIAELIDYLLRESSNTAYSVLGELLGGPTEINEYYKEKGWTNAEVGVSEKNGKALIGKTTVKEVYKQLSSILDGTEGDQSLREAAQTALKNNSVDKYGIRHNVTPTDDLVIYNKTGEDGGKIKAYRHDVGRVGSVGYVILTEGPGVLPDWAVGEFTAEMARLAGGPDVRPLASRAVRFARSRL